MGTDRRRTTGLWVIPLVLVVWIAVSAPFSVVVTAWGLAVICLVLAIGRSVLPAGSALVIRRRLVDVSILGAFACAFAFLALTARLG